MKLLRYGDHGAERPAAMQSSDMILNVDHLHDQEVRTCSG